MYFKGLVAMFGRKVMGSLLTGFQQLQTSAKSKNSPIFNFFGKLFQEIDCYSVLFFSERKIIGFQCFNAGTLAQSHLEFRKARQCLLEQKVQCDANDDSENILRVIKGGGRGWAACVVFLNLFF